MLSTSTPLETIGVLILLNSYLNRESIFLGFSFFPFAHDTPVVFDVATMDSDAVPAGLSWQGLLAEGAYWPEPHTVHVIKSSTIRILPGGQC